MKPKIKTYPSKKIKTRDMFKDTFCLTCGRKNCPKVEVCTRKELEK